jgi:hypothetical protein
MYEIENCPCHFKKKMKENNGGYIITSLPE